MPWLIDAEPYQKNGWVLEHHGTSNVSLGRKSLADVPTVDAEPVRHGRWIQTGEPDSDGNIPCRCSVCMAGDSHAVGVSVPYCWKCGAKMEGHE